jgi:F0F1-type ATP synthase membrane subunit a
MEAQAWSEAAAMLGAGACAGLGAIGAAVVLTGAAVGMVVLTGAAVGMCRRLPHPADGFFGLFVGTIQEFAFAMVTLTCISAQRGE